MMKEPKQILKPTPHQNHLTTGQSIKRTETNIETHPELFNNRTHLSVIVATMQLSH
jgi:hypothetical protein